jgi:hypothetical protein
MPPISTELVPAEHPSTMCDMLYPHLNSTSVRSIFHPNTLFCSMLLKKTSQYRCKPLQPHSLANKPLDRFPAKVPGSLQALCQSRCSLKIAMITLPPFPNRDFHQPRISATMVCSEKAEMMVPAMRTSNACLLGLSSRDCPSERGCTLLGKRVIETSPPNEHTIPFAQVPPEKGREHKMGSNPYNIDSRVPLSSKCQQCRGVFRRCMISDCN